MINFLFVSVIWSHPLSGFTQINNENIKKGILDLTEWEWEQEPYMDLDGEWEFYWKYLYDPENNRPHPEPEYTEVPSVWNNTEIDGETLPGKGYASYRLVIIDPDTVMKSLKIRTASSAMKVIVNGRTLFSSGKVGTSEETNVPDFDPQVVTFKPSSKNEIIIQISNYDYSKGGPWNEFFYGRAKNLLNADQTKLILDFSFSGAISVVAIFFVFIYLLTRQKFTLFFAVYCFLIAFRILVTEDYPILKFSDPDFETLIKFEFLTYYLGVGAFLAYFNFFFNKPMPRKVYYGSQAIVFIAGILVMVSGPYFISRTVVLFDIFTLGLIAWGIYIILMRVMRREKNAIVFLSGFLILMITIINDMLHAREIIETAHLFKFGTFIFIMGNSYIIARKFSEVYRKTEELNVAYQKLNQELENKVKERTRKLEMNYSLLKEKNTEILQNNEELANLNQALDSFVYSVSHDLRSPLASMLGLINLVENEKDQKTLNEYYELQRKSVNRLDNFIKDILDYSRNRRIEIQNNDIDFKSIVEDCVEQVQFNKRDSKVDHLFDLEQHSKFRSDKRRVEVIFNNLLSNAFKYARHKVEISISVDEEGARIEVADDGEGIEEHHIENLFKMFYRADETRHGSGLGLYIVKETLDKLNGSVTISSELSKGTAVQVYIPNLNGSSKAEKDTTDSNN